MKVQNTKQARIPRSLSPYKMVEVHGDGDVTLQHKGQIYVVTTDGDVFKKLKSYGKV